jgi:hypothetical protein
MNDHGRVEKRSWLYIYQSFHYPTLMSVVHTLLSYQPNRVAVQCDTDKVLVPIHSSTAQQGISFHGTAKSADTVHQNILIAFGCVNVGRFDTYLREMANYSRLTWLLPAAQQKRLMQAVKYFDYIEDHAIPSTRSR